MPELEDAGVATGTAGEAGADLGKQAAKRLAVAQLLLGLTTGVQVAATGQGNEPLGVRPELLRLPPW